MRAVLVLLIVCLVSAPALADPVEDRIRAQLTAQGYEDIEITRKDGKLVVQSHRDKLIMEIDYDAATGEVVSERARQADEGKAKAP